MRRYGCQLPMFSILPFSELKAKCDRRCEMDWRKGVGRVAMPLDATVE